MHDLMNQILEKFPDVQRQVYEQEFEVFYRMLWEVNIITEELKKEIVYIEEKRISEGCYHRSEEDITPAVLVRRYSALSFWLAQEHCLNNKTFKIASELNDFFLDAIDYLTPDERQQLRTIISETQLDFLYASGSDRIASIRMAPHIRAKAIRIKNEID